MLGSVTRDGLKGIVVSAKWDVESNDGLASQDGVSLLKIVVNAFLFLREVRSVDQISCFNVVDVFGLGCLISSASLLVGSDLGSLGAFFDHMTEVEG